MSRGKGFGILSIVDGVFALLGAADLYTTLVFGLIAIVFGVIAIQKKHVVLGWIGVVLGVLAIFLLVLVVAS